MLRRSSVLGSFIVALGALQFTFMPLGSCGDLPHNYDLVVALELARSSRDLSAIFGPAATECARSLAAKVQIFNAIDTLLLVPIYSTFLWSCVQALQGEQQALGTAIKRLVIVAAVADLTENLLLQSVTARPFSGVAMLSLLPWATGVKWLALGAINLGLALLYRRRGACSVASYAVMLVGTTSCLVAVLTQALPQTFGPWLAAGISMGWLTWLIVSSLHYWNERSLA